MCLEKKLYFLWIHKNLEHYYHFVVNFHIKIFFVKKNRLFWCFFFRHFSFVQKLHQKKNYLNSEFQFWFLLLIVLYLINYICGTLKSVFFSYDSEAKRVLRYTPAPALLLSCKLVVNNRNRWKIHFKKFISSPLDRTE